MPLEHFAPWRALGGGALIGLAASLLLLTSGRVSGVSSMVAGLVRPVPGDTSWRALFLIGLIAAGVAAVAIAPESIAPAPRSLAVLAVAGLLVGAGTWIGSGCTSGHGVCGISRGSGRSIVATLTFMATAFASVALFRWLGGAS